MENLPKVLIIGGPDVDGRIPIIKQLNGQFSISVLGSNTSLANVFDQAGIDYTSYPLNRGTNPLSDISTMRHLAAVISQIHPDLVHTFDTKPAVWGRLAAKFSRVPHIIGTLPGLGLLYSENGISTKIIRRVYQPLQKWACTVSDITVFQNSEDVEQFIREGIVSREKTVVLPGSGIETGVFDPKRFSAQDRKRIRTTLGLRDSQIVVTMISRVIRSKGVLEFAQAAQLIRSRFSETAFLLIGAEDYGTSDSLGAQELHQLNAKVTCLGARNDIPDLLAISDIFVFPTYYREGIPRVLLEAASMELPIVATRVSGCTEVVTDNRNGFLVAVHDEAALVQAIEALIEDPSLRQKFGVESRQRAIDHFELSLIAKQTASLYLQLLSRRKSQKVQ